jgi:hypothetical protein
MAIIRGKFFTLTPTSKVDIISNPGKRLTFTGAYSPPTIIGGDETTITENNVIYKVHTFTATGILTVTSADNNIATVEYLVVGGGGGGAPAGFRGGGGGAGGLRTGTFNLTSGTYTVSVGAGGAANTAGDNSFIGGSPTGPFIILSNGGGEGGNSPADAGGTGGSGGGGGGTGAFQPQGGAAGSGIPEQGFPGGSGAPTPGGGAAQGRGAGGGGAGASGTPGSSGGAGGIGVYNSIAGGSVYYAFGGPGGGGSAGPSNSGAGGGSAGNSGGSGIVIIRYKI